jgi:MFS family permease
MLNFGVYKYSMFTLSSAITMIVNMALFSGFLLLPIYVQTIRGISPLDAGLMLLPGAVLNALMSPVTGRMFDKFGGRALAVIGLAITTIASFLFGQLTFETSYWYLVIVHAIRMLGMSLVMMPVSTNGLNQLPKRLYPHGTAMNNTLNMVSGAIGTALLVTLMAIRSEAAAAKNIAEISQPTKEMLAQIKMQAMLEGINFTFIVSAIILIGALILAFFIKRATEADDTRRDTPSEPNTPKMPKLANN